jgi:hypothetical protein
MSTSAAGRARVISIAFVYADVATGGDICEFCKVSPRARSSWTIYHHLYPVAVPLGWIFDKHHRLRLCFELQALVRLSQIL